MNRKHTLLLMTSMLAIALLGAFFVAIKTARETALEMSCRNNIKQIGLALLNYESATRCLPAAIETKDKALWRSWRTHIYPTFMEQMEAVYDPASSWDSDVNMRLLNGTQISLSTDKGGEKPRRMSTLSRVPSCFSCPRCSSAAGMGVNYVVVCGEETAFPKSTSIRLADISDGLENTILVVESITCTPDWTAPRDLDFDTMKFRVNALDGPSVSSKHPSGALVCFADCEVYTMTPEVTEAELRAMLTIAGNENITRSHLINRGVLRQR
ncbi:DUF1559 domain-containing protein [Pirellulaceae bacterium SH501]